MNSWFTVKTKYTKQLEDGTFKRITAPYLLAAMTFTDAEARIYEELGALIRGEFIVTGIARTDIHDIFQYPDSDVWYKAVIKFLAADENGRDRSTKQTFLVSAISIKEATARIHESLNGAMIDFEITGCTKSPIVDIFPFGNEEPAESDFERSVRKAVDLDVQTENKRGVYSAPGTDFDDEVDNGDDLF